MCRFSITESLVRVRSVGRALLAVRLSVTFVEQAVVAVLVVIERCFNDDGEESVVVGMSENSMFLAQQAQTSHPHAHVKETRRRQAVAAKNRKIYHRGKVVNTWKPCEDRPKAAP